MSFYALPSLSDVDDASLLIDCKIIRTPVKTSEYLSSIASSNIGLVEPFTAPELQPSIELFFKFENLQKTGSFKFRGASHFLAKLQDHELENGVVAYSTGNHAQAVAHAAQIASQERGIHIPTYVVLPSNCPTKKSQAAQQYGATVIFAATPPEARVNLAHIIQKSTAAVLVPPADHRDIALGQATAVREFLQQVTEMGRSSLDVIIVSCGGGGLLVGAAAVCKTQGVLVFGAEPEVGGPKLAESLRKGIRGVPNTVIDETGTVADGLRSSTGEANWEHIKIRENVEGVFTASEAQIKEALRLAVETFGMVVEPSAAVPLAVALFNDALHRRVTREKRQLKLGVVITGGNISVDELRCIVPGVCLDGVMGL